MFKLNGEIIDNSRIMWAEICSSNFGDCFGFRVGVDNYSVEFYTDSRKVNIYDYLSSLDIDKKVEITDILDADDVTVWCLDNQFDPEGIEYCNFYLIKKTDDEFELFIYVKDYEYKNKMYNYEIETSFKLSDIVKGDK